MKYPIKAIEWVKVCAQSELTPGAMLAVEHAGLPPIALFNVDGTFHATSNICTHNIAVLTNGSFSGCIVECPLHGGAFDVTSGEATSYPCEKPLRKFPVSVVDGEVRVANAAVTPESDAVLSGDTVSPDKCAAAAAFCLAAGAASTSPVSDGVLVTLAGSEQQFVVEPGDTLLQGALRAGIGFPYECNSGGCGSCSCELKHGEVDDLWPQAPGLSERARVAGQVLACQTVPRANCVVKVKPQPRYVPAVIPQRRLVRWDGIKHLTPDMALLSFTGDGPADFLPGQYVLLRLAEGEALTAVRAYSMSNLPNPEGRWEFIIKHVPGGQLSPLLHGLQRPGTPMLLDGPYGTAFLQRDSKRDIVCIAGGAGLSPMASILRGAAAEPTMAERALYLFYGGRTGQDMCDAQLIRDDPLLHGRVTLTGAISDPGHPSSTNWRGETGFVHEVVARQLGGNITEAEIYLSGPPAMVDAVQNMLVLEYKVPGSQIHFDRFC